MNESKVSLSLDVYLDENRWKQMTEMAQSIVQSGAFPKDVKNAHQALVKMQYGLEIGLKPLQAITGTVIINGNVTPWGKTVVYLLRQAGWRIEYSEAADECTATVSKGDESYTEKLTFAEAQESKYTWQFKKDANGKYIQKDGKYVTELKAGWYAGLNRKLKLRYGALSIILKTQIPEVLGGAIDIAEVAQDFAIEELEVIEPEKPKTEEVLVSTPDERKNGLAEFLETEKNKPKTTQKLQDSAEVKPKIKEVLPKNVKTAEKPTNSEIVEGEVVKEK